MKRMNFLNYFVAILLVTATFGLISCEEDEVKGCTDPTSINYNADATVDDGSCEYDGEVVFWYGQATSEALLSVNSTSLTFYVDGEVIGSYAANVYFNSTPDCSTASVVTDKRSLGSVKVKSFTYEVIDNDNYTLWEGQVEYTANTCTAYELDLSKKK